MSGTGGFRELNRLGGQKSITHGSGTVNSAISNTFVHEVAQVEKVIQNEESGGTVTGKLTGEEAARVSGRVRIRFLSHDRDTPRTQLVIADPLNPYQAVFPLVGEYVLVFKALGMYYYIGPINVHHRISQNADPVIGDIIEQADKTRIQADQLKSLKGVITKGKPVDTRLGPDFKEANVNPVKVYTGDIVLQGRYGNSIRFGSSQLHRSVKNQAPNIVIRAGQAKKSEKTSTDKASITVESLDEDASSIYITSDETLPYVPVTKSSSTYLYSTKKKPGKFDGAQIFVNSDRVILQAKNTSIFLFAREGIHMNSLAEGITMDSEGDIFLRSNKELNLLAKSTIYSKSDGDILIVAKKDVNIDGDRFVTLRGNEIFIGGKSNFAEPIVMGTTLKLFWLEFLEVFMTTQPLAMMPTGIVNPALIARLLVLYAKYMVLPGSFNALWASNDNFVMNTNERTDGASVVV